MKLTRVKVQSAGPEERPYKLFDGNGLYLEVQPTGSRHWRAKYRFGGVEKRLALGVYPRVSLNEARTSHAEALKQLANGIDPSEHRKAAKRSRQGDATNSFELVDGNGGAQRRPSGPRDTPTRFFAA